MSASVGPVDPASPAASATTVRPARTHPGTVAAFDEAAALGTILGDDGADYRFHAAEIADGTRTIAVGAEVLFERLWRLGEPQAGRIIRVSR